MSTTFLNSFDMPLGSPLTDAPSLRPKFVDPMRTTTPMSPASQYIAALDPANFTSASPRLMRTTTPRKTSSSPSASSPRMPRYQAPTYGAHDSSFASVQLASSFRSTPTVASSAQSYSSMSSAFSMSSSRFSTPVRSVASTPSRLNAMATPPSTGRGSSRPSSPAPSARAPRARSPVLTVTSSPVMMMNSSSYGAPLTPRSSGGADHHHQLLHHHQQQTAVTMTPRQLLRELASTWKSRGSENQQAFKEGGYMTVNPGDTLQNRYELIVKLGWGEFSTVWLAFDRKATSLHRTFVAVKIAKCSPEVVRGTKYECCLLAYVRERVSRSAPVASLLDVFEANGKYGAHLCMSMPLLGSNMLCVIEQFKAKGRRRRTEKELTLVKEITAAVLKALGHLENANVLHTDLKPENVLVSAPDAKVCASIAQYCRTRGVLADDAQLRELEEGDGRVPVVTLADFGLSLLLEPSSNTEPSVQRVTSRKELVIPKPGHLRNERGMLIQTREYRAPEVLFGADFNCRTDVWSLGCMAYELITGDFLMDPKKKTRVERDMDVEHIAMMMQILGPVPGRITTGNGKHIRRYFDTTGAFLYADKYASYPRRSIAAELESFLEPAEAERAAQFIMSCFTYDPVERCHANDLLRHSWLRSLQL